jgi:hypothetical protein
VFQNITIQHQPPKTMDIQRKFYVICTVHFLDYIKSCSDKCTLFIISYFIQFSLKIVQHVSNYVSSSSGTQLFITPATLVWYSLKYIS